MFREKINAVFNELSPGQKRVAKYVLDNYHQCAFMAAKDIGEAVDVDAGTVVRFAQRLGYSGFVELKSSMQSTIERELKLTKDWDAAMPRDQTNLQSVAMFSLKIQIDNLQEMRTGLMQEPLNEILELLFNARRIYVVGEGISRRVGEMFAYTLQGMDVDAVLMGPDFGDLLFVATTICPDDVLVAIACTNLCPRVMAAVRGVKARGIPTLGLLGGRSWPLARLTDFKLIAPTPEPAIFTHYGVMSMLTKILCDALGLRQRGRLLEQSPHIRQMAKTIVENDAHFKADILLDTVSTYLKPDDEGDA